jgi:hypothetical protein
MLEQWRCLWSGGRTRWNQRLAERLPAGANIDALEQNRSDNEAGVARGRGIARSPTRFGPDIGCSASSPVPEDAGDAPAVILLNTGIGTDRHHRLYVPLAAISRRGGMSSSATTLAALETARLRGRQRERRVSGTRAR